MASSLKWYASNVKGIALEEANEKLWPVGMLVRRQARRNITENGQIDTKFLWNSIYVAAPDKRTQTPAGGLYQSTKSGRMERRENGPIVQPRTGVHVGVGAAYGIYPELENSYLYRAIEEVAGRQAEDAMSGLGTGMFAGETSA
jgi:hypothetical protein